MQHLCPRTVLGPLLATLLPAAVARAQPAELATLRSATAVLQEIQAMPGRRIPQRLLARAKAVAIVPNVIKVGFVGSVRHGQGVAIVRNDDGTWGNPIFVSLTGGGIGWQAGIQSTDVVLVFNSPESVDGMLSGKFTLGADASLAAGPVGRQASAATDLTLQAEILSYSRSRGLFAGVALDGSVLAVNHRANAAFYGAIGAVSGDVIRATGLVLPPEAEALRAVLATQSGAPLSIVSPIPSGAAPAGAIGGAVAAGGVAPSGVVSSGAAAGSAAAGVAAPSGPMPTEGVEQLRLQVMRAAQQLHSQLDTPWRSYLALPAELIDPSQPPRAEAIGQLLARFDTVQRDPGYTAVSQLPQFRATHELLRRYWMLLSQPSGPSAGSKPAGGAALSPTGPPRP